MKTRRCFLLLFFFCVGLCRASNIDTATFWTARSDGSVKIWKLAGDSVTGGDDYNPVKAPDGINCSGLAWCSLLSSTPALHLMGLSPEQDKVFVGALQRGARSLGISRGDYIFANLGGYGEFLYAHRSGFSRSKKAAALMLCSGGTFKPIVELDNHEMFAAADIAVDTLGRAWVLVSEANDYDARSFELRCYDPKGALQVSVPVSGFNCGNAYGLMLVNGRFYIAFGSYNKSFGEKLVPLVSNGTGLIPGTPIPFDEDAHDLASFSPGCPALFQAMGPSNEPILTTTPGKTVPH